MEKKFNFEYLLAAHKATVYNQEQIKKSKTCTCFYCGYIFNPQEIEELEWTDLKSPKGATLLCPMCGIDCILGDASGYPIQDPEFINACTEDWFCGISRISEGLPITKIEYRMIEVD